MCIVLTNSNLLGCESCNYYSKNIIPRNNTQNSNSNAMTFPSLKDFCLSPTDASYQGHYVLACGYDLPRQKIVYRNPSLCDRECVMSFQTFEDARSSYGTDDDIIFVDLITQSTSLSSSSHKERSIKSKIKTHSRL